MASNLLNLYTRASGAMGLGRITAVVSGARGTVMGGHWGPAIAAPARAWRAGRGASAAMNLIRESSAPMPALRRCAPGRSLFSTVLVHPINGVVTGVHWHSVLRDRS